MRLQHIFKMVRRVAAPLCIVHCALCITGCADMLKPESDLVMTPEQNALATPNDTIYSVSGTITLMQRIADRTYLLGELRGDLVQCTPDASTYLQNLAAYSFDNLGKYNNVADYYAVINNCNYFINTVDTAYTKHGQSIFMKEYAVMKSYRAWTYLQLALHYGKVPFYTHFLATEGEGQAVLAGEYRDLDFICNYFIDDIAPFVETPYPGFADEKFFIPVRVLLGELCLYAGRYQEAAQYYHDFLTHRDNPRPLSSSQASWSVRRKGELYGITDGYTSTCYASSRECISAIPMEATEADGVISRLYDLYSSTDENNYYYQLTASEALLGLSERQNYCYVVENEDLHTKDTVIVHLGDTTFVNRMCYGDVRLAASVTKGTLVSSVTSEYSSDYQEVDKIDDDGIPLYRLSQIYLHYAEALNRAGFPSAAMTILKYGVCPEYINQYVSSYERENAGTLLTFSQYYFVRENVIGMHARGCGQSECDTTYVLPMPEMQLASMRDTIEYQIPLVEDMIIDEAALECFFEGTRFLDLQRVALRRSDPSFLADRVARRGGTLDAALRDKLLNKDNWYLPLPNSVR